MSDLTPTPAQLDELLCLHEAAVPLPYRIGEGSEGGRFYMTGGPGLPYPGNELGGECLVHSFGYRIKRPTAEYVVAAANLAPGLVARVRVRVLEQKEYATNSFLNSILFRLHAGHSTLDELKTDLTDLQNSLNDPRS